MQHEEAANSRKSLPENTSQAAITSLLLTDGLQTAWCLSYLLMTDLPPDWLTAGDASVSSHAEMKAAKFWQIEAGVQKQWDGGEREELPCLACCSTRGSLSFTLSFSPHLCSCMQSHTHAHTHTHPFPSSSIWPYTLLINIYQYEVSLVFEFKGIECVC